MPAKDPEIQRLDRDKFRKELLTPATLVQILALVVLSALLARFGWPLVFTLPPIGIVAYAAWKRSQSQLFRFSQFRHKWRECQDVLSRLNEVLAKAKRSNVPELHEMEGTVKGVADSLYFALRRADYLFAEIQASEGFRLGQPERVFPTTEDAQATLLWNAAKRARSEYGKRLSDLLAGVHRTLAQSDLFIETLNTFRLTIQGYRFAGKTVEAQSLAIVQALTEAKMQLDSIDKALDELEMTPFPKTVEEGVPFDAPTMADLRKRMDDLRAMAGNDSEVVAEEVERIEEAQ